MRPTIWYWMAASPRRSCRDTSRFTTEVPLSVRARGLRQHLGLVQRTIQTEGMFVEQLDTGWEDSAVLCGSREHVPHDVGGEAEPARVVEGAGECPHEAGKAL